MITTKEINYQAGDVESVGFYAAPESITTKTPLILIGHAFAGRDQFACDQAKRMASHGYISFAWDIYGNKKLGKDKNENLGLMMPFIDNRALLFDRIKGALDCASQLEYVDINRIGVIGFCFGGLSGLDMARAGLPIQAVVSFHGKLTAPKPESDAPIRTKILVLHGHDDPMIPPQSVISFQDEMTKRQADFQVHTFGHTTHAFSIPEANDPDFGTVYQPLSAERGWNLALDFLKENLSFDN